MRVNIYAEEMTDRIEIIEKVTQDGTFTGLRFYLELPVTIDPDSEVDKSQIRGPFIHRPGDDDSAAVTFWGKEKLAKLLTIALQKLDEYYHENEVYEVIRERPIDEV